MNENNKKKQQLATEAITQLIDLRQNPDNKHFAFINIDEDDYNNELPTWGDIIISGDIALIAHALFEQRTLLPYDLRLHIMMHLLMEDTALVIEAQKRIKQNSHQNN